MAQQNEQTKSNGSNLDFEVPENLFNLKESRTLAALLRASCACPLRPLQRDWPK
jgi:hypothetical protein